MLIDLLLWPLTGFVEGVVGLLWPADDPEVRRLQRFIRRTILLGFASLAVGGTVAYLMKSLPIFLGALAIALVCLVVAGEIARRIETDWRKRRKHFSRTQAEEPTNELEK